MHAKVDEANSVIETDDSNNSFTNPFTSLHHKVNEWTNLEEIGQRERERPAAGKSGDNLASPLPARVAGIVIPDDARRPAIVNNDVRPSRIAHCWR